MLSIVANVFYVLIAIAMVVLILLQRGAGADAGSGFGGGASATVFGARGSANFLSRSTAVLAGVFFLLSLGMGIYLARSSNHASAGADLGVMAGVVAPTKPDAPASSGEVPPPATPAATAGKPAAAPAVTVPAKAPADAGKPAVKPGNDGKGGK